jgi:hypothetical protein
MLLLKKVKYNLYSGGLAAIAALLGKLGSETLQDNFLKDYTST